MKRRIPLRRSAMKRGTHRVGAASRARVRAGGVLALGRPSATLAEWRGVVADVIKRADGRCENPLCRRRTHLDPHHVVKRSQGGTDRPGNIVALCRTCHRQTDAAYADGRLVVWADGAGAFTFVILYDKSGRVSARSASTMMPRVRVTSEVER